MNVPFLDLTQNINSVREEFLANVNDILNTASFVQGKYVAEFEKAFASMHNAGHCITCNSGTAALHLQLWALDIKTGDEVIVPANTFIATAWGATLCGAKPVFVDVSEQSRNIDPEKIKAAITKNTRAIIAVHLFGQAADMDNIKEAISNKKIALLEDAAQAHLAKYKGTPVGTTGVSGCFSFYPGKNLGAFGEGGAVTTNDDALAAKIRMMRDHGAREKYNHDIAGHNYRMSNIIGASLLCKLKYLEDWTEARRNNAELYRRYLGDIEEVILPQEMDYAYHVYHLFVIIARKRNALMSQLKKDGIGSGLHYPIPLHLQKVFSELGYSRGDFPISEKLAEESLSLPMFPELNEKQIAYIGKKIKEFYSNNI